MRAISAATDRGVNWAKALTQGLDSDAKSRSSKEFWWFFKLFVSLSRSDSPQLWSAF